MAKALEAFRTISEVADELDVQKHVLRFWENKFPQVRPMKRGGGRRYYRPDDLDLLRGIRFLLHREGYTIKGVQKLLREQGLDYVKACWQVPPGRVAADPVEAPTPKSTLRKRATKATVATKAVAAKPAAVAIAPEDYVKQLRTLATELEECRKILLGGEAPIPARVERATK